MEGCVMKIHLTSGEKPFRIATARQIPLHWRDKAERVVQQLIREKILAPQEEPTDWCAPGFFVAKKNGDLRLVVDYTNLNKYVRRPIHTFPSAQEIIAGIDPESTVFAKLDATQGYHQVPLEDESSKLTTFLLPSGRYRFLRAPMGLSCSSDEFCRRSDKIIEGLPGVRKLVDDILIQAPNAETLQLRIDMLIARCQEHNFTLSRRKLEIGESVEFAGQIVSKEGVRPNPKFLQGLRDFPIPKSAQELRSFLGMVNQIASYRPDIARHTGVLQALLRKNVAFQWLEEHQTAFDKIRQDVISRLALNHFDSRWPTELVTDASRLHGLGFVLIQRKGAESRIIQCGSRSLSPAERNYSTLELELTAIVWGITKCKYFLKGISSFKVITDHRPLVGVFNKQMPQIDNARIVRLREKIMDYPFETTWLAGKHNIIADALSRAPAATTSEATAYPIFACLSAPPAKLTRFQTAAASCPAYTAIVAAFKAGAVTSALPIDHPARRLKNVWHQLSLSEEGLLMIDGDKLFVPHASRAEVMEDLHQGHCGYNKTLETARHLYYWPAMRHDIKVLISQCENCQRLKPSKPTEPHITTTARYPMEKISIDLFHVGKTTYMVTADRYSGYIWVDLLKDLSTKTITGALSRITRIFGIPMSCRTDGGPQFRGPFKEYCKDQGIEHEVSSPYNPQSNGHAEAAVKTAKHLIIKAGSIRFPTALAAWRNTAREDKPSPNQMFFGRMIRDTRVIAASHIETIPKTTPAAEQQNQHIPQPNTTSTLHIGDSVRIQDAHTKKWDMKATVTDISQTGRTCDLITDEGIVMRRNRRFLTRQCAA